MDTSSYELKLYPNVAEAAMNINKTIGDDAVKERTVERWF